VRSRGKERLDIGVVNISFLPLVKMEGGGELEKRMEVCSLIDRWDSGRCRPTVFLTAGKKGGRVRREVKEV
jgi:hypothetical protein